MSEIGSSVPRLLSWLDIKLGGRMLARYPVLTLVGGLAIASGIATTAGVFEFVNQVLYPTLPLDHGDRIVGIRLWHTASSSVEEQALHDFRSWRGQLESIDDLGAFRTLERNLIIGEGQGEPIPVAEISGAGFQVARVPPLMGRFLSHADEQAGAPAVVLIGYRVWQTRFGGDPDVVGRTVRLGSAPSTVVGVMPENFGFPIAHRLWIPFRQNVMDYGPRQGPEINIFGRLGPGISLDEAQAELTSFGLRAAADFPATHQHLRPEVMPYAKSILGLPEHAYPAILSINLFLVMLLVLLCGNVALLVFARAATRENEILVRNALGASRSRIISQLFAEALVLGSVGAVAGLVAAGFGLRWGMSIVESTSGELPFWFNDRLAPMTLLYAGLLTVMGAVIAGVVPAFKVTQGGEARLRQGSAGAGGLRFGGIWTLVIVVQIAVTVAFPVTSFFVRRDAVQIRSFDVGFPAEEYLSGRLEMDLQIPPSPTAAVETFLADFRAQFGMTNRELRRRLLAEPGVVGVTLSTLLPHMRHPQHRIEVDADGARPFESEEHRVSVAAVDLDFFGVLGAPVLSGRSFHSGDLQARQRVVVVNQSFVTEVLGSRNPVGRRVRYQNPENPTEPRLPDQEPGPWSEIIGVVPDLGMATGGDPSISGAGLYFPLAPDSVYSLHMAVHVGGDPNSIVPRLRSLATTVDPTLRLSQLQPLDEIHSATLREYTFWFRLTLLVSSLALLISTTGIYSVMSFTVSRRTREIGIRVALGSNRTAIITAIFRRPIAQVGLGVLAGGSLAGALSYAVLLDGLWPWGAALVVGYALLMMGVCMLACVVPTWRALRIEPTEALRVDG